MSGETDLAKLLATMEPQLDAEPYGYAVARAVGAHTNLADAFALIAEQEATTVIARVTFLESQGLEFEGPWAKISLTIHSSLSAVGLTAAVATALGKANISANVVAGFYHDHFFVQWTRRHDAMKVLAAFKS